MSKARARRRAEREAAAAAERERRRRSAHRRDLRGRMTRRLTTAGPRSARRSRLAARRQRQDGALLAALVAGHVALWLFTDSWAWRLGALVLSVLAWPVLVTVLFDRRPGQS